MPSYKIFIKLSKLSLIPRQLRAFSLATQATSTQPEVVARRNSIFTQEKQRQLEGVGRIDKINIQVSGPPEDVTLVMNRYISTPYDCARHISEAIVQRAALALVDDQYTDMHSPLISDCTLKFLKFKDADPQFLNKAFWRSCSVMLGSVIVNSFKEEIPCYLHSFPSPNVRLGSFVYDVSLGLSDWSPTKEELRVLSGQMALLAQKAYPFERLIVSKELALEMFEGNPYKIAQIPDIASRNPGNTVTVYRVGDHLEISRGPLVADTSFLGRCTIAAVHKIKSASGEELFRFQGVALPKGIMLNHFAYGILEERARKVNPGRLPGSSQEDFTPQ